MSKDEIRFRYGGVEFIAKTPEAAARTVAALKKNDAMKAQDTWTPELFRNFISRLGPSQQTALSTLVSLQHATDEQLRYALGVADNQALAGVLSGISKQATALDIPARSVFSLENLRTAGKRRSTYTITDAFLQIAKAVGWPPNPTSK